VTESEREREKHTARECKCKKVKKGSVEIQSSLLLTMYVCERVYMFQDGTEIFRAIHTAEMLQDFKPIGLLVQTEILSFEAPSFEVPSFEAPSFETPSFEIPVF